jgi:hypothetical protein
MKHTRTLAGVIAFVIGLIVLVLITSASRKKIGKPGENLVIKKSQIFMICLNSTQIVFQTELVTTYNEFWSLIVV